MLPLQDFVLIQPDSRVEAKQGAIVLPDNAEIKKKFGRGTVLAVGPGLYTAQAIQLPPDLDISDHILYYKEYEVPVIHDGREIVLIQERHILAVFDSEDIEGETSDATD